MTPASPTAAGWTPPVLPPLDPALAGRLRRAVDAKAKPPGSLGRLEDLAVQLGAIQGRERPAAARASLLVFAGDHGLNRQGVSAYPSAVTAAMVELFLTKRATVNAFARAVGGVAVQVVDAGVDADFSERTGLLHAKVARGTGDATLGPAMSPAEAREALDRGVVIGAAAAQEAEVVALGEMGIGNTASASLLLHRLGPAPLEDAVGQGAGHDAAGLARKVAALERAAARTGATDPFEVLCEFGGYEIAMMAGAALGAAAARAPVVVDGFIASAAALLAVRLQPALSPFLVFAHRSAERGHRLLLERLGIEPLLQLDLRLGEGTGAVLALPLLRAAAALVAEVADLAEVVGGGP